MSKPKQNNTDKLITRITSAVALLLLAGLVAWGIRYWFFSLRFEQTNDAQVEEYINPVAVKVTGYISRINFEENEEVKKGDTLVVIDNSEYQAQQQESVAALENARAQLQVINSSVGTQVQMAEVAESVIEAAKARLWNASKEYDRYEKLLAAEAVTMQQFENVKTALDIAKSELKSVQEQHKASLSRVTDIANQKQAAFSEVRRREAVVNQQRLQVSYTVITAPYNGKMGRRIIQEGQLVTAGQTLGFIVDAEAGKWVVANFKETQLRHMKLGDYTSIELDAYPGKKYKGVVESFSGATGSKFALLPPDNSTGNFVKIAQRIPVRIRLLAEKGPLLGITAGMSATVTVEKNKS